MPPSVRHARPRTHGLAPGAFASPTPAAKFEAPLPHLD
jgi:hypothetical protein